MIEILAARLLAPYLGVSLEVFTGIIGVILAGISLGAWLGGRAADRGDPTGLPGLLLIGGGISALVSPFVIDLLGPTLGNTASSVVLAAGAGFLVPAALLSALPPVIVKIRLASLEETGAVVGSYSAIGTAGAIFGTFITGFFLVAAFPTRPIIAVLGLGLVLVGLVLMVGRRDRTTFLAVGVGALLAGGLVTLGGPCEYETAYHCAVVEIDDDRPSGRVLLLDRIRNSYVDVEDPTYLEFRYVKLIADIVNAEAPDRRLDTLGIGGGGFTLPGYFASTRPQSTNTVLEIDGSLVEIGRTHLGLTDAIDVRIVDARTGIAAVANGSLEVVVGDAYSGASVPWHLTTVEFHREIARALAPDGIYTMNVIDYGERKFIRAQARTLLETFDHVALFAPNSYLYGDRGGNYILAAGEQPIDVDAIVQLLGSRGGREVGIAGAELTAWIGDAPLLTDDFAPVDQMLIGTR